MLEIKQAVILCGGLGKRLKFLTKQVPKPMIDVCGKPFLEHLIIQLKKNGIKNIVLLIGYKADIIKNYFKNGKKYGVKISYSYDDVHTDTGTRLYNSKKLLKENFILLYSDNYTSININKLIIEFEKNKKKILLLLSKKKNGNCSYDYQKKLVIYDTKRSSKKKYVEIGYMLINKKILNLLDKKTTNFSKFLTLVSKKKLVSGTLSQNGYLSIGDKQRLNLTKKYFSNNDILLSDRDRTLNLIPKYQRYLLEKSNIKLNINLVKQLPVKAKYICITNQAGLSTGDLKKTKLYEINKKIRNLLIKKKINILDFYVSHHHFTSKSFLRKPNPGMFFKASKKYKFILDKTFYIGDDIRDIEAAYNANTFIYYIGKKKLNLQQNKKFRYTLLRKSIKKTFYKMSNYEF